MKRLALLFSLLFCVSLAHAGQYTWVEKFPKDSLSAGKTLYLQDPNQAEEVGNSNYFSSRSHKVSLIYGREDLTDLAGANWEYQVIYRIDFYGGNQGYDIDTLTISGNDNNPVYEDIRVYDSETHQAHVTIISATNLTGTSPGDIRLEAAVMTERYRYFDETSQATIAYNSSDNVLYWNWLIGAESYELEWAYIDDYSNWPGSDNFQSAVRIATDKTWYEPNWTYKEGKIVFRVRGVGRFTDASKIGTDYSYYKFGDWSDYDSLLIGSGQSFEPGKNYQYVVTFTEHGKYKKVMSYMDGAMKSRQSLTNLSTDETTVVTQTEFDEEGRGVITTIPIPINGIDLGYVDYLNQGPTSTIGTKVPYRPANFFNYNQPDTLSDLAGAGNYYSPQNSLTDFMHKDFVPDAQGYPFTQVEFKRDHTGRVSRQSGVGADHILNSDHETKFFYGDATSTELYRLFGSNVGDANHYLKKMTVDPNGQVAFAWQDQEERVIATALAGPNPDNLLSLGEGSFTDTLSLNANNVIDSLALKSITQQTILNEIVENPVNFFYDFTGVMQDLNCFCADCEYDLSIYVLDPLGNHVPLDTSAAVSLDTVDTLTRHFAPGLGDACPGNYSPTQIKFEATFVDIGDYTIYKVLSVDTSMLGAIRDSLENCADYPVVRTIEVDSSLCAFTCEEQLAFMLGYQPDSAQVEEFCGQGAVTQIGDAVNRECDAIYTQMIAQISPGGWMYDSTEWASVSGDSLAIDSVLQLRHREYCHYLACKDEVEGRLYEVQMSLIDTWPQATNAGYDDPINTNPIDPWFDTGGPGVNMASDMDDLLNTDGDTTAGTGGWRLGYAITSYFNPNATHSDISTLYSMCATSACEDTMRWRYHRGAYLDEKQQMLVNYREDSLGCPFYNDVFSIVPRPSTPDSMASNPEDFGSYQMTAYCNDVCQSNVDIWLGYLLDSCSSLASTDSTHLHEQLMDYCLGNCGNINPYGDIFEEHVTAGLLDSVINILDDYSCQNFLDSLAIPDPNTYDTTGSGDTLKVACTQFDPCFVEVLKFLEANWDTTFYTNVIPFGNNSVLKHCFPSDTGIRVNAAFVQLMGSSNTCYPLLVLDATGDTISLLKTKKIQFLSYSPTLPGGLNDPYSLGGNTYDYQEMSAQIVQYVDDTTEKIFTGYLYADNSCSPNFMPVVDSCLSILGAPVDSATASIYSFSLDLDSLRDSCLAQQAAMNAIHAQQLWQDSVDMYLNHWLTEFKRKCFRAPFAEDFRLTKTSQVHQYTLYYYDQAGNLVQTVPPEGVDVITIKAAQNFEDGTATFADEPNHRLKTKYKFNSLNQMVWQSTPDGGEKYFWYDEKDQLRVSQDAEQSLQSTPEYSYSRYDELGRVVEVGQVNDLALTPGTVNWEDSLNALSFPHRDAYVLRDITRSFYDDNSLWYSPAWQNNLRMRVAAVWRENTEGDFMAQSFYSYDDHGNVKELRHDIEGLGLKTVEYEYELVSGNVLRVHYQKGQRDYFSHQYCYDADNRITEAWTTKDGHIYDRDARYFFYPHGPLSRVEIGEDAIQGCDYYYTVHGWIKGVNTPGSVAGDADPGHDGYAGTANLPKWTDENKYFGRDEMAFGLGFYEGDYLAIGSDANTGLNVTSGWNTQFGSDILESGLYNGNIPLMVTEIDPASRTGMQNDGVQAMAYQYDQLNRIRQARTYRSATGSAWNAATGEYNVNYTYDKNGNLKTLDRWANIDNGLGGYGTYKIDDFEYEYDYDGFGNLLDNKLDHVDDGAPTLPSNPGDLRDQSGGNYDYDAIGNLISDTKEQIDSIIWDDYDKILRVKRASLSTKKNLEFAYDGMGNRVKKVVANNRGAPNTESTYYVRDAQGNVLAVYDQFTDGDSLKTKLAEWHIYGSDRLGICKGDFVVETKCESSCSLGPIGIGSEKPVIISEIFYDSPATTDAIAGDPVEAETHEGEYIVLYNVSQDSVDMAGYTLQNSENGGSITLSGNLAPNMRYLVAYRDTTDTTSEDRFKALTQLDDEVFSSGEFEVLWHKDSLSLGDNNGVVQLVDPYGTLRDQVSYGSSYNLVANNGFVPDSLLDSLEQRSSLTSLRRASFSEAYADNSSGYVADQPDPHSEPFHVIGSTGFSRKKACKYYELKNHLGNVLVTVSDLKLGQDTVGVTDTANYYFASVLSAQDYYPFGWLQPSRKWNNPSYRYGFNGKEKDDEWSGNGNNLDFGARVLDARVGRWLSVDPDAGYLPSASPYNFALSNPIIVIDPDGEYPKLVITTNITGYTVARIYGMNYTFSTPAIIVPTYEAILYDVKEDGSREKISSIHLVRDGWYKMGEKGDYAFLMNRAFEPAEEDVNLYSGIGLEYPEGLNLDAYALKQRKSGSVPAEPLLSNTTMSGDPIDDPREDNNVASGVMVHISGYYTGQEEGGNVPWYYPLKLGGSYGCFGFIPPDDVFETAEEATKASDNGKYSDEPSNSSYNEFTQKVNDLKAADKDGKFHILVEKRNDLKKGKVLKKSEILKE